MKKHHFHFYFWISSIFTFSLISCSRNAEIAKEDKTEYFSDKYADSTFLSPKIFKTFFLNEYDFSHLKESNNSNTVTYFFKHVSNDGKRIRTAVKYKNINAEIDDRLNAYLIVEGPVAFSNGKQDEMKNFLLIVNGQLAGNVNLFDLKLRESRINFIKPGEYKNISISSFLRITPSSMNIVAKMALPCGGMEPVCTDYYWVEYDTQTGVVVSVSYLYTKCEECNKEGGGGSPSVEESCNTEELNSDLYETSLDVISYDVAQTVDKRTRQYKWEFARDWFYSYYSTEQGTHKKVGNQWHWEKFEHLGVSMSGFGLGVSTSIDQHNGTPYILTNTLAYMKLDYQVVRSIICTGFPVYNKISDTENSPEYNSNVN